MADGGFSRPDCCSTSPEVTQRMKLSFYCRDDIHTAFTCPTSCTEAVFLKSNTATRSDRILLSEKLEIFHLKMEPSSIDQYRARAVRASWRTERTEQQLLSSRLCFIKTTQDHEKLGFYFQSNETSVVCLFSFVPVVKHGGGSIMLRGCFLTQVMETQCKIQACICEHFEVSQPEPGA